MEKLEKFLIKFIGAPYSSFDCWDITKLFYLDVMDIDFGIVTNYGIPGQDEEYRKKVSNIIEIHSSKFQKVDTPIFGDIILFKILGITSHIGVYIGEGKFLHSIREVGCAVEPVKKWEHRLEGYYRWRD